MKSIWVKSMCKKSFWVKSLRVKSMCKKSVWVKSHWGKIGVDGRLAFVPPSQVCFNMFQSISPCTISWQGSGSGEYGCLGGQVKRKGGCRDGADCPNCHECFWTKAWENSHPRSLTAESKDAVQSTYDLKFEGCRILTRMRKS